MSESDMLLLGELLLKGGWTMVPLYACSIAGLVVFAHKLIVYRAARLSDLSWEPDVIKLIRSGNLSAVPATLNHSAHPAVNVVNAIVSALKERPAQAKSEAIRVASLELQKLERNLSLLSFLAQVAPLLGLLGTVLGMIDLFSGFQQGGNSNINLAELSAGIWKALITTAAGLAIAVPTLAAHSYLSSRVDNVRLDLSDLIQRILYATPLTQPETAKNDGI
ncbi:biopolymer transport protein ExbB [Nitrosomonas sp. Nm51]|uniref:MotA/TolQ/ExbB proton channel family protein n=1 Tax=Nitrosomonas sp. Nm51 TaxID=133720 RepID=UPI0008C9DE23|nr:MotA/TolQ/ExbB proton channel family protein [Nitrosomonas sp. Nm51]SER58871.1 biopolymer transport protein ExbB [Nitrosomonas sp. Nm51]